jgi:DHA2 family methylenomycin A resistance protein-like MFS transporter
VPHERRVTGSQTIPANLPGTNGWLHLLTTDRASPRLDITEATKVSVRNAKTRHQPLPEAYLAACSDNAGDSDRSTFAKSLALAAISLGYGVIQLDVPIVNTALSSIGTSLGGGVTELQWVVSAYTIAFAALILTAGALGDRIGAKKVFMMGFALFTT